METLTTAEENDLVDGVKQAVDLVDGSGLSPNDAITKVAREHGWPPGKTEVAAHAFNNGRQLAQWRANTATLDKLAEFPLADFDEIRQNIWGDTKTASVDLSYSRPPAWLKKRASTAKPAAKPLEKTASEVPPGFERRAAIKLWGDTQLADRQMEDARLKYAEARTAVQTGIVRLQRYFRKAAMDRLPFSVVEDAAATYWGDRGRKLFDVLAADCPREKRAADNRLSIDRPLDRSQMPFTVIETVLRQTVKAADAKAAFEDCKVAAEQAGEALAAGLTAVYQKVDPLTETKTAGIMDSLLGSELTGPSLDSRVAGISSQLDDPDHENALRQVRSTAMLNSMMTDPDSPISGYGPEKVMAAYNEIAQMSPRLADQPAALRPLLARHLAGQMQPFEVHQALGIEKGLKDAKNSVALLGQPHSLVG